MTPPMLRFHPLLGRDHTRDVATPLRTGGATGRVGEFGMTRVADGKPKAHKGVDWLAVTGWPVFAAHAGIVGPAGWQDPVRPHVGFGQRLYIESRRAVRTVYAHLSEIVVASSSSVAAGDLIGYVGRTGNVEASTPDHLHFEVHRAIGSGWAPIHPLRWLDGDDDQGLELEA